MSDTKPVETLAAEPAAAVAPASETPAVEATTTEEAKPEAPAAEAATEAPAAEGAAAEETTALPKEEKTAEGEVKITAEPIYSGALGYKAPGLIKSLTFSKKYFWFGEEAAVSKDSLAGYLRGEKGEHAHSTVAWASKTGKGLLFFAKHADQKSAPQGALKLAEATEVAKEGNIVFSFKLHGHKHSFEASNNTERDGWVVAVEKSIEEAKAAAESVTGSEEYKETIEKLGKPAVAAGAATKAEEGAPKKSTDVKPEGEDRRGSSSSSSGEEAQGKKKKSKSRSVSRKRASVFGGLLGKKEHEKKDVKKDEAKPEEVKEGEEAAAEAPAAEAAVEAPAVEASEAAATEEAKPAEGEAKPEEAKVEAPESKPAPKANKRTSIFGGFFEKVRSPATEKKESEAGPAVPPKDGEEAKPVEGEVAKPAEGEEVKPVEGEEAAKPVEGEAAAVPATTPAKEKGGFFSKFGKAKSPAVTPAAEAPKEEAKPVEGEEAAKPVEGEEAKKEAPAATPEPGKEKRRTSFFGNFGAKNNEGEAADGEKKRGLGGLFRNPSKAVKGKKADKENSTPAKVEEEAEAKPEEAKPEGEEVAKDEEEKKDEEPKPAIGDVVPDAVAVGQSSTPAVQATA